MARSSKSLDTAGCRRTQSSVLLKTRQLLTRAKKKGLHAKVVARAEELLAPPVPDGEGKVAYQVIEALGAPGFVGVKNEFNIGRPRRYRRRAALPRRNDLPA